MILLIGGPSHTGKTLLAQKMLEKYGYPYLSIDHLKMGLIRSGQTGLTPTSGAEALAAYLWPIVREMVKTAVENGQNLIVEGCYIPYDWEKDFGPEYRSAIRCRFLVMSEGYIRTHWGEIQEYAGAIEDRGEDDCTMEVLLRDNRAALEGCKAQGAEYILIDESYPEGLDFLAQETRREED